MGFKTQGVVLGLLLCAGLAQAQVKGSGTLKCGKADVQHKVDVGPNHAFTLNQTKCMGDKDKPFEIDGVKSGGAVSTDFTEIQGAKATYRGYYVDTMENGDKAEYSFHGTGTIKDGAMTVSDDYWTLVRGTGKLKGAKGKGTCKGTGAADGSITWDCDGDFTLASK